jgi:ParB/RepB/Spo0J family partition protein
MPMTFRRVETGHYRAESERENMMYNIAQEDGEWVVTCNGEPIGNRYDTYGAARAFANDFEENPIDPALSGPVDPPASEPASLDETEEAELANPSEPIQLTATDLAPLTEADRPELLSLLPDERPEARSVNATLARIHPDEWINVAPPVEMVESVRSLGIFQPVALIDTGNREYPFRVAAGRRRLAAANAVGLDFVPALVFPAGTPTHVAASIALTENMNRRPNPISELEQIETLVAEGANEAMIVRDLRIPLAVLRRRMRLSNLIPEFRQALTEGRINVTICQDIARHSTDEQRTILGIFQQTGRVTPADLRRIREAREGASLGDLEQNDRAAAVDDAIVTAAGTEGWAAVLAALQAAERAVPAAADDNVDAFYADLSSLMQRIQRLAA